MTEYELEPDVPGSFGDATVIDWAATPPAITRLDFIFDGWFGDDLVTSDPVFLVTARLRAALEAAQVTGVQFDHVDVSTSEEFDEFFPGVAMPVWEWMRVTGFPGRDDGWSGPGRTLTVSQRFMDVLAGFDLTTCTVTAIPG